MKVPAGGKPALPAVAGAQLLDRLSGERAVGAAALGALLVGEGLRVLGMRPPWFGAPPGAGPIPAGAARAACEPCGGVGPAPGSVARAVRRPAVEVLGVASVTAAGDVASMVGRSAFSRGSRR